LSSRQNTTEFRELRRRLLKGSWVATTLVKVHAPCPRLVSVQRNSSAELGALPPRYNVSAMKIAMGTSKLETLPPRASVVN
jgi:hypothetical protein